MNDFEKVQATYPVMNDITNLSAQYNIEGIRIFTSRPSTPTLTEEVAPAIHGALLETVSLISELNNQTS
jgi:hypothetical protein